MSTYLIDEGFDYYPIADYVCNKKTLTNAFNIDNMVFSKYDFSLNSSNDVIYTKAGANVPFEINFTNNNGQMSYYVKQGTVDLYDGGTKSASIEINGTQPIQIYIGSKLVAEIET